MMYGVWKVISKQALLDNKKQFLINWWNKVFGKQHNKNGTDYSNNSGVDLEYLYYGTSKGKPLRRHYRVEWVS